MTGVSVSMTVTGENRETLYASDAVAVRLEDLHFDLGEGPGIDALVLRAPVGVDDLAIAGGPTTRWPLFAAAALDNGARGLFAYPLVLGAARLGVLLMYRDRPGALDPAQQTGALRLADAMFYAVLDLVSRSGAGRSRDGEALGADSTAIQAPVHRAEVYQAAGMVMAQLGVRIEEATVRLRAYAFAHDRPVNDVARDIVARILRLADDNGPDWSGRREPSRE